MIRSNPEQEAYFQDSSYHELETIMRVAEIQEDVREQLRYHPGANIETMPDTGISSCHGYTIKGSQALEEAGIQHRIVLINEHSALLVNAGDKTWLIDMFLPHFSQPIEGQLTYYTGESNGRHVARLDSRQLINGAEGDYVSLTEKHPWLISGSSSSYLHDMRSQNSTGSRHSLVVSSYDPKNGRNAIYHFARFKHAYKEGDLQRAADAIIQMSGQFPDLDLRNDSSKKVKSIVKRLAIAKDFETATAVTESFFSSFPGASVDSRIDEYKADCLRYISQYSGQSTLAELAIKLYKRAKSQPKSFDSSISAKLEKCNSMIGATA